MARRVGFGNSQRYDRSHLSKSSHHGGQGVPLEIIFSLSTDAFLYFIGIGQCAIENGEFEKSTHARFGLEVSWSATTTHRPCGTVRFRYAIAAIHSASIEGSPNAGPHTWSSSTILGVWSSRMRDALAKVEEGGLV